MCFKKRQSNGRTPEDKATGKRLRDEAAAQHRQEVAEAKELARRYPCTNGAEVITGRPPGVRYNVYRELRATQQRHFSAYLRYGRIIYVAAELYDGPNGVKMRRTRAPYRRGQRTANA